MRPIDFKNPFVRFYLTEEILQIVSEYLGYVPQLFEVYIEKTIPSGVNEPIYSQNWHRDPEEKRTLKVFLYLNDVNEQSGPFIYVRGSQPTSQTSYAKLFRQKLPHGSYPDSIEVSNSTNASDHYVATGLKGTIIFCDTAGLHRGGYATTGSRIMSTGFFPSKYYSEKRRFTVDLESVPENLGPLAKSVLRIPG
jgi:hypothetical protein